MLYARGNFRPQRPSCLLCELRHKWPTRAEIRVSPTAGCFEHDLLEYAATLCGWLAKSGKELPRLEKASDP